MKISRIIALALVALPLSALAQSNCTGTGPVPNTCHIVSDVYPTTGIQPVTCKLFRCVGTCTPAAPAFSSATVLITGGAASCFVALPPASFQTGTYTVALSALAADGSESAMSVPFSFVVSVGPPSSPVNVRLTQP